MDLYLILALGPRNGLGYCVVNQHKVEGEIIIIITKIIIIIIVIVIIMIMIMIIIIMEKSFIKNQDGRHAEGESSPRKEHSIEFMSSQYDSFIPFKTEAERQIQKLISRVDEISVLCNHIRKSIEDSEAYSYQFNIKIVGVPTVTYLYLTLFAALGVDEVSLKDSDTAHRLASCVASNRHNAIICKFVRRLVRQKVMAARRGVSNLNAENLGFSDEIDVSHINL